MPLLVKVSAINRLMYESKKMRKVVINTNRLHGVVTGVVTCVFIYLVVWTTVDPPKVIENNILVENGGSAVHVSTGCASEADGWVLVSYVWQALLLLSALVLAIQSRNIKQEFNESQSLAFMVYSHTLFLVVRALVYSLPADNFEKSNIQPGIISLCLSLDTLNTLIVYFSPKFYIIAKGTDKRTANRGGVGSGRENNGEVSYLEPPPSKKEVKDLMEEACHLLAKVTEDRQEGGDKGGKHGISEHMVVWDEKNDRCLTRSELIKFRKICTRLGRAQFDWERTDSESRVFKSSDDMPLPKPRVLSNRSASSGCLSA
jgi:hypothetical protein